MPLNHCSDLSSYSFLFLKGLCPGTFLLFSLYFAYKGLKIWMSCLSSPDSLLSHLAESFFPTSSLQGRRMGVGLGVPVDFPSIGNVALTSFHSDVSD
jgi:hypothetical protein